jgi:hypothetical protein
MAAASFHISFSWIVAAAASRIRQATIANASCWVNVDGEAKQLLKPFNDLIVTQDEDFAGGCSSQPGVATNWTIQIITTYLDIIIILSSVVINIMTYPRP